jgi:hypothetical protein
MFHGYSKIDPVNRFRKLQQIMRADPSVAARIASVLCPGVTVHPAVVGPMGIREPYMHIPVEHEVGPTLINDPQMWFSPDLNDPGPGTDRVRTPLKSTLIPKHSEALAAVIEDWKAA